MGQLRIVTQSLPADFIVALTTTAGLPATGLTFAAVQCSFLREGDLSPNSKTLDGTNFDELGLGFYRVTFTAAELNTVGQFVFTLFGAGLQNSPNNAQIRSAASLIPTSPVTLPTCDITGSINDLAGNPIENASVSCRVLGTPTISAAVGVTDDLVTTVTDENGSFVLTALRLASVEILISRVNYRRQLVVPNAAAVDLFTGIP